MVEFTSPAPMRKSRGRRFWIGLILLIGGGMCACGFLVVGLFSLGGGGSQQPSQSQSLYAGPISEAQPAVAISATPATADQPAQLEQPSQTPAAVTQPAAAANGANVFSDDFSNLNGGWADKSDDNYRMGYFQQGNYAMSVRVPNKMAIAFPPYPFSKPIQGVTVQVKAKSSDGGDGYFGVVCHFVDKNNYYRVSFTNTQFAVNKLINGQYSELTTPYWAPLIGYTPEADGYLRITTVCADGRIQVVVNDVGQSLISDSDLSEGDVLLFAASGSQKNDDGLYEQAFFDDFSAQLVP
jgi:hypothetical protein